MFRIITPILSIFIAIAVYFFFVQPMYADIRAIQEETNEYREAVAKAGEFNHLLDSLISKRNAFSASDLERLEAMLPPEVDEMQALIDLEALAIQQGLLFDRIQVDLNAPEITDDHNRLNVARLADIENKGQIVTQDITFNLVGTYADFKQFLSDVERSLVLMEVTKISFDTAVEGDLYTYVVGVRLFSLPGPEEISSEQLPSENE